MPVAPVLTIEIEQELDGRWPAEVPIVPGALAEQIEHGEPVPEHSWLLTADGLSDRWRLTEAIA